MSSSSAADLTAADFFTTIHRISGQVQTGPKPLSDLLNDRSQSYLLVFNVYVSRLGEAGAISIHSPVAYLSKENLNFVIVPARETRAPDRSRFTIQEYDALAIVPGFELQGRFAGPHRVDLRSYSPASLDQFFVLVEASAQSAQFPAVAFRGEAILINRDRLEGFCLNE